MSYSHVGVTLTPGQIKRIQSAIKKSIGVSVLLKKDQLTGTNKLALTDRQVKNFNKAKQLGKGIKIDLSVAAVKDTAKTGGILPFIPILAAAIGPALAAAGKAAALGAVGTAAGIGIKKALGQGYKRGGKQGGILPIVPAMLASMAPVLARRGAMSAILKAATGQGYKKKGRGLRLPGTPASWYGKGLKLPGTMY